MDEVDEAGTPKIDPDDGVELAICWPPKIEVDPAAPNGEAPTAGVVF